MLPPSSLSDFNRQEALRVDGSDVFLVWIKQALGGGSKVPLSSLLGFSKQEGLKVEVSAVLVVWN